MHVVLDAPCFNFASRIVDRQELIRVQTLVAQFPLNALDKPILGWLSRPDERRGTPSPYAHSSSSWPSNSGPWSTVIEPVVRGCSHCESSTLQRRSGERGVDLEWQAFGAAGLDDGRGIGVAGLGQNVGDEVHRRSCGSLPRILQRHTMNGPMRLRLRRRTARPRLAVSSIGRACGSPPSPQPQQPVDAPITIAPLLGGDLVRELAKCWQSGRQA